MGRHGRAGLAAGVEELHDRDLRVAWPEPLGVAANKRIFDGVCFLDRCQLFGPLVVVDEGGQDERADKYAGSTEDQDQFLAALKFTSWFFKEGNKLWFPAYGTISKSIEAWAKQQEDPKITKLLLWADQQQYIRFPPPEEEMRQIEDILFDEFPKAIWRNDIPIKKVLNGAEKRVNAALAR